MNYKVGDKVRIREWDEMEKEFGLDSDGDIICEGYFMRAMKKFCGKIFTVEKVYKTYYVLKGVENFCFSDDMLEPIGDNKIVITTDGKTTLARLYDGKKVVKTAKAICAPEDEFNFMAGAELAFNRLTENKPKYYNGKVVCVKAGYKCPYTIGKIYEFVNGHVCIDDGCTVPYKDRIKSLDEWNSGEWGAEFIELKE